MNEVKGMREKLSDEEERVVDDEEIEEWMESVSELGLGEQEWQSIFEAYARFEEVIIRGKRLWQEQEAQRRKKMGYIKKRVRQTQDRHKRSAWATDG